VGELAARRKDGSPFNVNVSSSAVLDEAGRTVCMMASFEDITVRKLLEATRNFLLQYSFQRPGEDFFNSLARYLAQSLGMEYVCIDRLVGDGLTARTVAVYNDGQFEPNVEYALKDTPCGEVAGKSTCCFKENVRALFPNDAALRDLKAESYIGATLWSFDGRPIGLIAVIGQKPLANPEAAAEILKLVTIRAAGELERTMAEENLQNQSDELKIINDDLTRFNNAMVNRELRMIELKKQVNELCVKLGRPPRYPVGFADDDGAKTV
jgi:two-component system, sensor histidine kinase